MRVSVVYGETDSQHWIHLKLPVGSSVEQAIKASGILDRYPVIDLRCHKVGVFGKFTQLDADLGEGDRVEIYRPIIADPKTVTRRPKE